MKTLAGLVAVGTLSIGLGCGRPRIAEMSQNPPMTSASVSVGQELHVTLGSLGPAYFVSPPEVSSGALTFLGVVILQPYRPSA